MPCVSDVQPYEVQLDFVIEMAVNSGNGYFPCYRGSAVSRTDLTSTGDRLEALVYIWREFAGSF